MGIVAIKNHLAGIIANALETYSQSVKVLKSGFREFDENKPQTSKQIVINHKKSDVTLQNVRDRSFYCTETFDIEVSIRDLRTDDTVQDLTDLLKRHLIGSVYKGMVLKEVSARNEGFQNGIWRYVITVDVFYVDYLDSNDDCLFEGIKDFSVTVSVSPNYS